MHRKKVFIFGMVLLIGFTLTGCAWFHTDDASPYRNLGSGFGYYAYPNYQGDEEQNPVFDEHHHHHR